MCFSATASFTTAVLLAGVGVATLRLARRSNERPFAAIPLLFAVQQFVEGILWVSFSGGSAPLTAGLTQLYSFFSHVLWPVYVPAATWLLQPPGRRRRWLGVIAGAAFAYGGFMLGRLILDPVTASPAAGHIAYVARYPHPEVLMALYLFATTGSLMMSSLSRVRWFGVLALAGFALAYAFYARWFISVWCFFAAALSVSVLLHFATSHAGRPGMGGRRTMLTPRA